jgi:hypothetical protein
MKTLPLIVVALSLTASPLAFAQSAATVGAGSASGGSGTVGTGGSAAAGGTSASTLGLGGTSTGPAGTASTIGGGGSAATSDGGKATTSNKINENPNMLKDQAKAKAQDGGTFSKSMTDTKIKNDELDSRTKSMAHVPGGPPVKSTTTQSVPVK